MGNGNVDLGNYSAKLKSLLESSVIGEKKDGSWRFYVDYRL